MNILLFLAVLGGATLAGYFAVRAARLKVELADATSTRDAAVEERARLAERLEQLPGVQQELAAASARLEEIEAERDRLLSEDDDQLAEATKHVDHLRRDLNDIKDKKLPELLSHSSKAASGAERVEDRMTGWMRTIANPQSRGAFGELAVENQLKSLGLELGRDYMRQVTGDDGQKRPDYIVRTGEGSVIIDAKFVLDEDAEELDGALEQADEERLAAFGRRLKSRAEDLAKRDYSTVAGRGPAVVLLYVPVEGAHETLRALPGFSAEKFFQRHRVYVVTPSQLGLALGLVAEVAHKTRHDEEVAGVADALVDVAEQMAELVSGLDQHGKHLGTAFKSYNNLVAMTNTRGKLWRRASTVWDFARRRPKLDGEVRQINPPREDAGEVAERWREASGE
jgi:DNA recombination protein RmuC